MPRRSFGDTAERPGVLALPWRRFAPPCNLRMTALANENPILRSVAISYVQGTVRGPTGKEASVRFLIDSGATYSLLPDAVWQDIGLAPQREMEFVLADGTTVRRAVSDSRLPLPHREAHSPGVPGPPGEAGAWLCALTLQIRALGFCPL